MPRTARASVGGICYHVIKWGNARTAVFRQAGDYQAFVELLRESGDRRRGRSFLDPGPVPRPGDWVGWLNQAPGEAEVVRIRHSVTRGSPFGSKEWAERTARRLGLEASLRPRGRARK